MLAVTDTGSGMDEATQAHIFEPFFTTKAPGRGTGLGLSTVHGIVRQCGGDIFVYSAPGQGTTFKIYLPRATERQTAIPVGAAAPQRQGNETVLVVEDQDSVRAAVLRTLTAKGYTVLEASTPRDALSMLDARGKQVDLLLTDLVLPEMTGRDLADLVRKRLPQLAVLYMSGFAGGALAHQGVVEPGMTFLQKPFTPDILVDKVRTALDAPRVRGN
jgi:CheY-like chemotaxis protein